MLDEEKAIARSMICDDEPIGLRTVRRDGGELPGLTERRSEVLRGQTLLESLALI